MRQTLWILVLGTLLFTHGPGRPCSVFNYDDADTLMVGRNLDWVANSVGYARVIPPQDGGFGMILFSVDDHGTQGGMNDQGLVLGMTATPFLEITNNPDGLDMEPDFWERLMRSCATVDDALDYIGQYDLGSFENYLELGQFIFTDTSGDSALVEGDVIHTKQGNYQIVTNYLQSAPELGYYPCGRYELIEDRLTAGEEITADYFIDIIDDARGSAWGGFTVYSQFYEPRTLELTLYWESGFDNGVLIDLADELEAGEAEYTMEEIMDGALGDDDDDDASDDDDEVADDDDAASDDDDDDAPGDCQCSAGAGTMGLTPGTVGMLMLLAIGWAAKRRRT